MRACSLTEPCVRWSRRYDAVPNIVVETQQHVRCRHATLITMKTPIQRSRDSRFGNLLQLYVRERTDDSPVSDHPAGADLWSVSSLQTLETQCPLIARLKRLC